MRRIIWHGARSDVSPQYALVEALARQTSGLLLLTATPQQLGPEGHFARLRLLDPDRYRTWTRFSKEAEHYEKVAKAIDRLMRGKALTKADRGFLGKNPRAFGHNARRSRTATNRRARGWSRNCSMNSAPGA